MVFDESDGYGLGQAMTDFWDAWHDLANNPSAQPERTVVRERSMVLAETFNKMHADLQALQRELDVNIEGTVREINEISVQVAELNEKIAVAEIRGQNANDFRDTREQLLKDLSGLIDIQTFENSDGHVTVTLQSGKPLVENDRMWELSTEPNGSGFLNIFWTDSDGNVSDVTSTIEGGKLKGWLEVRDVSIPHYLNQLDELAGTIIDQVNTLHQSGYGLEDPVTGIASTGYAFFSGSSAADMAVDTEILNDTNKIAASATASGVPGDNSNAIAIAGLQQALVMSGNTATCEDYYNAMVGVVGADVQEATLYFQHQTNVMNQLSNYRESISGVSVDEEMVNLIKFQHAYDAAAKLITTVDEMLITVLNMR